MSSQKFEYNFKFEDGTERAFQLPLNKDGLLELPPTEEAPPAWTALDHGKCPHCPYDSAKVPHCPVARNLARAADHFKDEKSFKKTTVFVKSQERFYGKQTDLQTGLQSLFGLIMSTSDCPHMSFLRTLARFHLPFATVEETKMRIFGAYLVAQLEKHQKGQPADFETKELNGLFAALNTLNLHVINRIRSVSKGDADQNALVILDSFASLLMTNTGKKA